MRQGRHVLSGTAAPLLGELGLALVWVAATLTAGVRYYPYRDDWVYLGRAATWPSGRWAFYLHEGLYGYRPISFLADVEGWSRFWPDATIPWAILMSLGFLAALAARRLIHRTTGHPFWLGAAMMLLWPGAVEGQYWVTAASGIVLSLLGAVAAGWAVVQAATGRGRAWWLAAGLALLLANLSYEQIWGPGIIMVLALGRRYRQPWARLAATAGIPMALTAAWYLAERSALASNGKRPVTSWAALHAEAVLVTHRLAVLWGRVVWQGFAQSLSHAGMGAGWWILIAAGAALAAAAAAAGRAGPPPRIGWGMAAVGVAVMGASVAPWYATTYGWVSVRAVATTVVGAGLLAEGLLTLIPRAGLRHGVAAALLAAMLVSGAGLRAADIHGYDITGRLDHQASLRILRVLDAHHIHRGVIVRGTPVVTWVPGLYPFGDHLDSSISYGPALAGMLRDASAGRDGFGFIPPGAAVPPGAIGIAIVATRIGPKTIEITGARRGVVVRVRLGRTPRIVQVRWEVAPPELP